MRTGSPRHSASGSLSPEIPRRGSINDSCFLIWLEGLRAEGKRISLRVGGEECKRPTAFDLDKGRVEGLATEPGTDLPLARNGIIWRYAFDGPVELFVIDLN